MINRRVRKVLLIFPFVFIIIGIGMLFMPLLSFGNVSENEIFGNDCYTVPVGTFTLIGGSFSCPDCHGPGGTTVELRVDSQTNGGTINGVHSDGTLTVTITGDTGENGSGFSWSSNIPVCGLIVKLGSVDNAATAPPARARFYSIPAGTLCGSWAGVPGVDGAGISHVSFCYDPTTPTTTTTTVPSTTTTTVPSSTTSTSTSTTSTSTSTTSTTTSTTSTTTSTTSTTTTTQPTTTTTVPDTTTTTVPGTTTTTVPGTTTTTVPGTTTTTVPGTTTTVGSTTTTVGELTVLAFTGFNSLWYVAGSVLIALGIVMGTFSLTTVLKRR